LAEFSDWVQVIADALGGDLVAAGDSDAVIDLERKHRDNERLP
jgi:hypothetical protein